MDQTNNKKPDCPLCEVPEDSIETLKQKGSEANSKKEEYDRKKREKEKEYVRKGNVNKMKKTAFLVLPAILVVAGLSFAAIKQFSGGSTGTAGSQGVPVMEVNPKEYDAGAISMAAGKIKYGYEIKNTGDGELKINNIKTSCHCTTARLKIGDKESPDFGMDSAFSSWSGKIPAGGTGYLEVTFDPAYHGSSGVGDAIRAVYFSTNDPKNKNGEVRLSANVTP